MKMTKKEENRLGVGPQKHVPGKEDEERAESVGYSQPCLDEQNTAPLEEIVGCGGEEAGLPVSFARVLGGSSDVGDDKPMTSAPRRRSSRRGVGSDVDADVDMEEVPLAPATNDTVDLTGRTTPTTRPVVVSVERLKTHVALKRRTATIRTDEETEDSETSVDTGVAKRRRGRPRIYPLPAGQTRSEYCSEGEAALRRREGKVVTVHTDTEEEESARSIKDLMAHLPAGDYRVQPTADLVAEMEARARVVEEVRVKSKHLRGIESKALREAAAAMRDMSHVLGVRAVGAQNPQAAEVCEELNLLRQSVKSQHEEISYLRREIERLKKAANEKARPAWLTYNDKGNAIARERRYRERGESPPPELAEEPVPSTSSGVTNGTGVRRAFPMEGAVMRPPVKGISAPIPSLPTREDREGALHSEISKKISELVDLSGEFREGDEVREAIAKRTMALLSFRAW